MKSYILIDTPLYHPDGNPIVLDLSHGVTDSQGRPVGPIFHILDGPDADEGSGNPPKDAPAVDVLPEEYVIEVDETGGKKITKELFKLPEQSLPEQSLPEQSLPEQSSDKSLAVGFNDSFDAIEESLAALGLTSGGQQISYEVGEKDLDGDGDDDGYILASVGDENLFRIILPDTVADDLIVEMFGDVDHLVPVDKTLYSATDSNGISGVDIGQYLKVFSTSDQGEVVKKSLSLFLRFKDGLDDDVIPGLMIDV